MIDFDITLRSDDVVLRPVVAEDFHEMKKLTADSDMWIYFTRGAG